MGALTRPEQGRGSMNRKQLIVALMVACVCVSGCVRVKTTKRTISVLKIGESADTIRASLGEPKHVYRGTYQYVSNDGVNVVTKIPFQIWEYYVDKGKNSELLYIYNNKLMQIENLSGHPRVSPGGAPIGEELPDLKFKFGFKTR